jgi:hypothetical protein
MGIFADSANASLSRCTYRQLVREGESNCIALYRSTASFDIAATRDAGIGSRCGVAFQFASFDNKVEWREWTTPIVMAASGDSTAELHSDLVEV